jgi:hypothetical protein
VRIVAVVRNLFCKLITCTLTGPPQVILRFFQGAAEIHSCSMDLQSLSLHSLIHEIDKISQEHNIPRQGAYKVRSGATVIVDIYDLLGSMVQGEIHLTIVTLDMSSRQQIAGN